jgi:outer membrane receptor protein involved in Fe transport
LRATERIDLRAGLAALEAKFRSGTYGGVDVSGNKVPLVPKWLATAGASWSFMPRTRFDANLRPGVVAMTRRVDRRRGSGRLEIPSRVFAAALVRLDLVGDLLAFTQGSKPGTFNSADVYEHVIAAVIRLDEAIALGCVKPLHGSHAHVG